MRFFELLLVRSLLFVGLPLLLVMLAVGPQRFWKNVKRGWRWVWQKRLEPEEILTQVVDQYEKLVVSMRDVLAQSEIAEKKILQNIATSEKNVTTLETETKELTTAEDELGARAALYKLNLEQQALLSFPRTVGSAPRPNCRVTKKIVYGGAAASAVRSRAEHSADRIGGGQGR